MVCSAPPREPVPGERPRRAPPTGRGQGGLQPVGAAGGEASGRAGQSAHPAGLHGAQDVPGPPGEPAAGVRLRPAHLEGKNARNRDPSTLNLATLQL